MGAYETSYSCVDRKKASLENKFKARKARVGLTSRERITNVFFSLKLDGSITGGGDLEARVYGFSLL